MSLRDHKRIKLVGNGIGCHGQLFVSGDLGTPMSPWLDWGNAAPSPREP